jgi:hypothetical protein
MAQVAVPIESAIKVVRESGSKVTLLNQSVIDVYFDTDPQRLNASQPGVAPLLGSKLVANGGEYTVNNWPLRGFWFRSAIATTIEVQP